MEKKKKGSGKIRRNGGDKESGGGRRKEGRSVECVTLVNPNLMNMIMEY